MLIMTNSKRFVCLVGAIILMLSFGSILAAEDNRGEYVTKKSSTFMTGDEDFTGKVSYGTGPSRLTPRSGVVAQAGITWYEYQHNGSIGRQIVDCGTHQYIHFVWMHWPNADGPKHVVYNAYDLAAGNFIWNEVAGGGKEISGTNGGYSTIDVTSWGAAVVGYHEGPISDTYAIRADWDTWVPLAFFDHLGDGAPAPPNCEGWVTGNYEATAKYIWPVVDWDMYGEDTIIHVISTEGPPTGADVGEIQTIVYYRKVNDAWPICGTAIDSIYNICPVVRSDTTSDKVAIVWLKPMYYDGDPNDPCGWTQWQNDVVYLESTDGGLSFINHTAAFTNVTDYSQGHALAPDQIVHQAYTDVTTLYDTEGCLHIVWNTPLRDLLGDTPCAPLYATKIWHWDDCNQCISLVYDATRPRFHCPQGAFMMSTGKMSVSECNVNDSLRIYVSFSRMGAHTSADGDTNIDCSDPADNGNYANSDIFITGSTNGGLTWGPCTTAPIYIDTTDANTGAVVAGSAVNATNTFTPDCLPGDCMSEHWGSMAKYMIDSTHIVFIEDHDAGAGIRTDPQEGMLTENPVQYMSGLCFWPGGVCGASGTPQEVNVTIAPEGEDGCTVAETAQFDLTLTNTGNQPISYVAVADSPWVAPQSTSGAIGVGCNNSAILSYTVGPYLTEGTYTITIAITITCGEIEIVIVIVIRVTVKCFPPEYATLSTACWSVDVWNVPRVGGEGTEGQMYWFSEQIPLMFDEGLIITYAEDTCDTWFSTFDGSDSNAVLKSQGPLTIASFGTYEYAHGLWSTQDEQLMGEVEHYLPTHPDTCVLIERIKVCNNTESNVTIHLGEAIDWDIPDGQDGSENQCGADESRQMVYQYGPAGAPEENYYGGASFCHDIPGAIVLDNATWVYPNSGYQTCEIGGLLAGHTGFVAECADSMQDRNSVYVIAQNVELEPDSCVVYCKVKTSSLTGLADLQALIDKGKQWIQDHELDCPGCVGGPCDTDIGNANGSTAEPTIDIDDVVYLIAYIFSGGPPPMPYPSASGDANCSCGSPAVDIDDVVYLIAYIFSDGPPPCSCEEWVAACGPLQ
jgi:hypothetical protein